MSDTVDTKVDDINITLTLSSEEAYVLSSLLISLMGSQFLIRNDAYPFLNSLGLKLADAIVDVAKDKLGDNEFESVTKAVKKDNN
jgi:hypothetical protein